MNANTNGDDEAVYYAAARKHMGIGVAENWGKVPLGVVLPTTAKDNAALDSYLQSCARERTKMMMKGQSEKCGTRRTVTTIAAAAAANVPENQNTNTIVVDKENMTNI